MTVITATNNKMIFKIKSNKYLLLLSKSFNSAEEKNKSLRSFFLPFEFCISSEYDGGVEGGGKREGGIGRFVN